MIDIVIKNGKIVDGCGNHWYKADIGITGEKITKIGNINENEGITLIDASDLVITPGFIDMHSHADFSLLKLNKAECMVRQGITTAVVGNCGFSLGPIHPDKQSELEDMINGFNYKDKIKVTWSTFKEYLDIVEAKNTAVNIVPLVGFTSVRLSVLGFENKTPTVNEIKIMQDYVKEAMESGAFGFSTGLIYAPQMYAKTDEIIELAKVSGKYNGMYFSHIRNESDKQIEAINEFLQITKESGCRGQLSHHKIGGEKNWGMSVETLRMLEDANRQGFQIRWDQYPYIRGANLLSDSLPGWVREGGKASMIEKLKDPQLKKKISEEMKNSDGLGRDLWDKIFISSVSNPKWKEFEGLSILDIAKRKNLSEFDTFIFIILENDGNVGKILEYGSEKDLERILRHPMTMIGTDGLVAKFGDGKPHPRLYGTFPKVLGKYGRDRKLFFFEEAIRKMTSCPAQTLGILDRGSIRVGNFADIVILNQDIIIDKATYMNPHQYPEGIEFVIVNGTIVVNKNKHTDALPGKVIRRDESIYQTSLA